jgi:hypothetical protein
MTEPHIPDRSAEPALRESLDHGAQSRTAAHSEDVSRDAGKGPRDSKSSETDAPAPPESTVRPGKSQDDSTKPDPEEVEEMTGVPKSSEELSQM